MVVMVSVAPPGGPAEGGEEMVTLADQKRNEKNKSTKIYEEEEDDFRPLVIDTRENNHSTGGGPDGGAPTAMEQDKQRLLRQLSRDMALYKENNPSDTEEDLPAFNGTSDLQEEEEDQKGLQDLTPTPSVFPGLHQSDSSTPSSRVHSPALSTTSNSGGSGRSSHKLSHPQKARRKTDKILPVDGEKYICPICHVAVISNTELTKHIRSHNNGGPVAANSCTICGKVLSSQSSLDRHMLVHSGERPFKCKFCNMAFTTNGNMHRHMRIHEKEVAADGGGKPQVGKEPVPIKSRYATTSDTYSQVGFTPAMKRIPPMELPSSGSKRKLTYDMQQEELVNSSAKRRTFELMSSIRREFSGMSPEGRAVNATTPSPPHPTKAATNDSVKQETKDGDDQQEYQCPECGCSFLCRYGLESHLKTHPDFAFTCQLCPRTFSTRQDLIMHKFEEHKCSVVNNADKSATSGADVAVGFHELDFIDFTCDKFPLVAEAWCDENVHCASSAFHDFTCKICQKAFPCKASLRIHSNAHAPDNMSECRDCEIHLPDSHAHAKHMLKHIGEKVVSRVSQTEDGAESPQEVVSKEDFLTCFGLAVSNNKASEKKDSEKEDEKTAQSSSSVVDPRHEDRRINEEYFPMLQRMAQLQEQRRRETTRRQAEQLMALREQQDRQREQLTNHRDPEASGCSDLADIQQILSHFGSGGGLVQSLSGMHSSPQRDNSRVNSKAFNPMVMVPGSANKERDNGMRLPVMVTNGFVPIQNRQNFEDPSSSGPIESIQCKYCPEIFNNQKSHKIHERTHLGLAPYKCSLCPYSSADKSTLIRHLRTHNGERPFQCRICSFAFTTKANCERHVRKKHMRFSKKDIDDVIGYNQYPTASTPEQLESFGSPDTVCKYCGEDFKFFRALKHHLRSHSSCTRKPFTCKICESGFSTKANAVRHVQKHHPEVDQRLLEEQILTNELLAAEVAEDTKVYESIEAMGDRSLSPVNAMARSTPTMGGAYSSPKPIVISPIPHNIPIPSANALSGTYITSPPILNIPSSEAQNMDDGDDQPLDFSMKSTASSCRPLNPMEQLAMAVVKIEQGHMSGGHAMVQCPPSSDEPMDLTVKPSPSTTPHTAPSSSASSTVYEPPANLTAPSRPPAAMTLSDLPPEVAARALPQLLAAKSAPDYGVLRYKKEYQKFYNPTLQVHIRSHTNERPFACAYCSASFTIKTNLERHLKTRHPYKPLVIPDVATQTLEDAPSPRAADDPMEVPEVKVTTASPVHASTGVSQVQQPARSPRHSFGGSDDSNCDLSSVTKILDATNPNHFRSFFNAAATTSDESASEPTPNQPSPFARYQEEATLEDSSNHSSSTSRAGREEQEDLESDGADSDVVLTQHQLSPEEIIRQTTEKLPIIKIRNPKSAERGSGAGEDGSGSPAKKKRNSYADSPHKLMCPYCPRAFPWISSLNRHILTHTGQKPFKCPQCPVMFSTKSNRERHLVRKHGLNVLDPATRQMMDRPFKCHLCVFSSFSTGGNLTKHYTEKHPEHPVPEHLLEEGDANNNTTDTYSTECRENIQAAEASKAKRLEFGDEDEDSKDGIQDGLGHKLMDHVTSSLIVSNSRSSTPTPRSLSPAPSTTPAPPTTTTTTTTTTTPASPGTPERHQQINPERDNYNVDKITECWKCDEDFGSRKGLLRHLKEHNIDLAFKCYLCDASFDHRIQCLDHMTQKHAADWSVLCEKNQIGDVSEFADCMNRIVEQNFIGNAGYGKKLTEAELAKYKVQLAEDMKPESDYAQRKVYCSLCPKRFWSLQDLRRHMRSHTGERPFECDLCQKRFTLKHSMMRHRRKHTDAGAAASLSASDDEMGHGPEFTEQAQAFFNSQKRREAIAKMTSEGDSVSLSAKFGSDLLHSMLGVEDATIDEMLNSASADTAARVLGVSQQ